MEYFQEFKDGSIIQVRPSEWAEALDQEEASVDSSNGDKQRNELEQKMEKFMWKINMFFVCVGCVVFGSIMVYGVMKSKNVWMKETKKLCS